MQQQMESRDEETLELKETYSSLQQEVDIKTKKLKKVATLTGLVNGCPSCPPSTPAQDTAFMHAFPVLAIVINKYSVYIKIQYLKKHGSV